MHTEVRRIEPGGESNTVLDLEGSMGAEVVPQALSHPRQLLNQGNPKPSRSSLGPIPDSISSWGT